MLCIGKRTNYDAQVLAQVSGRSRIGVPTGMPRLVPVPKSDEPARHIRKVASLVEYRPVFAW